MARYAALLRAVNVGGRRAVKMATARDVLDRLDYAEVSSQANSGNLLFTASGKCETHEKRIRAALEDEFGFELTTFVRTAAQIRTLADAAPFGPVASGHTHFVLFPLRRMTAKQKTTVRAMSNERDEVIVKGRDVHWLIRSRSPETTLGPKKWADALPDNPTTARNITMLGKLAERL